jgi:hypothetical protein
VIIIVFTHDYKLKEFYKIPWTVAQQRIQKSGTREKLSWNSVKEYKVEIGELPRRKVVGWFN